MFTSSAWGGAVERQEGDSKSILGVHVWFYREIRTLHRKKSQNPLNVAICVFTDDRDIPYPENKFHAIICFDLLQLKILIFLSCVWHEFTHKARELVSKWSILSSLFLQSPCFTFSLKMQLFLHFIWVSGLLQNDILLRYLQWFPMSWLLQWFKKSRPSVGIFPLERNSHWGAGICWPAALRGWWCFDLSATLCAIRKPPIFSHFLTRERAVWLPRDTLGIVRIV